MNSLLDYTCTHGYPMYDALMQHKIRVFLPSKLSIQYEMKRHDIYDYNRLVLVRIVGLSLLV